MIDGPRLVIAGDHRGGEKMDKIKEIRAAFNALDKSGEITCPFCGEEGFDRIGLKWHLIRSCEEWAACFVDDMR